MAVEGFVGLPGKGKTYLLTMRAYRAMAKGVLVFANYHLKGAGYFENWAALMRLTDEIRRCRKKALVCIDEINLWAPSRFWQRIPEGVLYLWAQTRKRKIDILWSAQSEKRVDTVIREVTNNVWYVFSIGPFTIARSYYPEDLRKAKSRPLKISVVLRRGYIYRLYDTYEMIDIETAYKERGRVLSPGRDEKPGLAPKGALGGQDKGLEEGGILVGDLLRQYMESKGKVGGGPNGHDDVEWW